VRDGKTFFKEVPTFFAFLLEIAAAFGSCMSACS